MNEPFLPPIEKPKGLVKNLVYTMLRRQFGKVLTPMKVHLARLPNAFGMFYARIGTLEKKLLDYAAELTRDKQVGQGTFDRLGSYYSEREICEIVWVIASEL